MLFGNAAPTVAATSSTVATLSAGDGRPLFALRRVGRGRAHYIDVQPFAGAAITSNAVGSAGCMDVFAVTVDAFATHPGRSSHPTHWCWSAAEIRVIPAANFSGEAGGCCASGTALVRYTPGLRNIDGDIASLGGFASDANEFSALLRCWPSLCLRGFEQRSAPRTAKKLTAK